MPSSCRELRAALAACLQNSDCIMVQHHTPLECLSPPLKDELPIQCQQIQRGFRDCKRGMVDMRKRFRGNQPVGASLELEAGTDGNVLPPGQMVEGVAAKKSGQLYGGKPAFEPVKERSGDEVKIDLSESRGL
ncbi:hypothetical protein LTR05_000224 [Lithohypha guttulata]|uniref:Cytochrome c oxidase assembly factor 5 n=1 Tax=Lithohypha guttulata TaxID=1690604 RepID=A0AAN7T5W3_9EURO|nr:hypothetical protein LTR05_000224 [Lithohypha guttulata]